MPRINLDLEFLTHPKTLSVSPFAQLLFIRSIIYSAKHLTDGFVPSGSLALLTHDMSHVNNLDIPTDNLTDLVTELESVGWWIKTTGGHAIHDYLDYQLSRKDVESHRKKRAEASANNGKLGGRPKKPTSNLTHNLDTNLDVTQNNPTNPNPNPKTEEKKKKSMPLRATAVVENEWIEDLKKNPAYLHINWVVEWGKMDAWFSKPANRHRKRTQSFILSWINKVEAPMEIVNGKAKPLPGSPGYIAPPHPPLKYEG